MKWLIVCILVSTFVSCSRNSKDTGAMTSAYSEPYRPQFHFSPAKNWTNDPNGLVYYEGEYHLFFQYNPFGDTWGHMSWGHAVSKDLLHWEELPVAIAEYPDPKTRANTMIFSGTVVVDKNNSSGLCEGNNCLIAIYTSDVRPEDGKENMQHQSMAYSNDKGRTWKQYDKNPVLNIQRADFRDPKVFWYEPEKSWIMALVIPDLYQVQFYKSNNLKEWKLSGEFGGAGDTTKIWECPDLYQLPIENEPGKSKWVLSLSGSHPQGGKFVGVQYFVGEFDGTVFKADDPKQKPLYIDYGKDFYAGIVYNNIPKEDGRTIMIGWANNWAYGGKIPTSPWRSAMSIPRELSLRKTEDGIRLYQRPLTEVVSLRGAEMNNSKSKSFELEVEILVKEGQTSGIEIFGGIKPYTTIIAYDDTAHRLFIDRTTSGSLSVDPAFPGKDDVTVFPIDGKIKLHVFVDQSIIEVFINDGQYVISDQFFPADTPPGVKVYRGESSNEVMIKGWEINSAWPRPN